MTQGKSTSKNQSYREKKRGRPNKSETAPSAVGIDPRLPPLNKFVRRLLALSSKFLLVLGSSVLVDWHLYFTNITTYIGLNSAMQYILGDKLIIKPKSSAFCLLLAIIPCKTSRFLYKTWYFFHLFFLVSTRSQ